MPAVHGQDGESTIYNKTRDMKQFDTDNMGTQMPEDYKPTYIKEQHNNNCQQFFGPITNCTFTMPPVNGNKQSSKQTSKPNHKNKTTSGKNEKPKTLKYFKHGNNGILMKQRERVTIIFQKFNEWGWINDETSPDDFDSFFEGEPRHCNIKWTGTTTTLTILLTEILKQDYIGEQTNCKATSLVQKQFGITPNSDRSRLKKDVENRIKLTLFILDIKNPLPNKRKTGYNDEEYDIQDKALYEIFSGQLHSTKSI